jgi:hypothetical protein
MMGLRNYDIWRTREPEPYNGIGNWRLGVTVTVDVQCTEDELTDVCSRIESQVRAMLAPQRLDGTVVGVECDSADHRSWVDA